MKSIYVPNESFQNRDEVRIINKILYDNIETLYNYIDENIEIWIIGNKDQEFLQKLTQAALDQNQIYDPFDELPVSQYRRLLHVAVINQRRASIEELTRETIYGNIDYNIYDFVRSLFYRLMTKFPKNPDNRRQETEEVNNPCKGKSAYVGKSENSQTARYGSKYPDIV